MKKPSWSLQVKIRDSYTCRYCGEGTFDHQIVDAHHIKRKADRPDLADAVENGETLDMFCHAKEHYKMGDYWGCVLILLRLIKLMRKRANWPVIDHKQYQTLVVLYHEGKNRKEAAEILKCNERTVTRRINWIKKFHPDKLDEKGRFIVQSLPKNYQSYLREQF